MNQTIIIDLVLSDENYQKQIKPSKTPGIKEDQPIIRSIEVALDDDNNVKHLKGIKLHSGTLLTYGTNEVTFKNKILSIDFSFNSIEKLGKNLFDLCPNLQIINFTNNKLKQIDVNLFSGCEKSLTEINFGNNEIGELHPDLFSGCQKLTTINFEENKLKELNENLFSGCKTTLEKVLFYDNSIERLDKNLFDSCSRLEKISFNKNKIKMLDEHLFSGCKATLAEIFFARNEITDLHPDLFSECKALTWINFEKNKLKELNKYLFTGCKITLEKVFFSANSIEKLDSYLFSGCSNLKMISFRDNKLKELDENLFNIKDLEIEFIDFSYNQIALLPQSLFKQCVSLQSISFNNNKLKKLNDDIFKGCNYLTKINFSCNCLKDLGNNNFESVVSRQFYPVNFDIIDINFSNNFLTSIPYFSIDSYGKYRIDLRDNLNLLDSFHLLFRKLNKNDRDQELFYSDRVEDELEDKDIVLDRQNNIESLLFIIILNFNIYNNEDENDFKEKYAYLNQLEQKTMSVLDFLILLGNDSFSNHNLFHLNESFEIELKKTPNLVNFGFRMTKAEAIEALCRRNDYSTFKKIFDIKKLKQKVENPKEFIERINFLKCFDIALKNNNEKIAKYLLKILNFYSFNLNTKVEDPTNDSYINKIDDKFNEKFLDSDSLSKLDIIKIINALSEFFKANPKKEKYRDRNVMGELEEDEFKGGYELFLDMEGEYFRETFDNLVKNELNTESNLKTFNQIFLKIYVEVFFQLEWFEAIEFYFDQCKKYTELELKNKKDQKIREKEDKKDEKIKEFLPFFCFNKIGYIQRQEQKHSEPQSDGRILQNYPYNKVLPDRQKAEGIQQNQSTSQDSPQPQSKENKAITVPFSTFFIFKLVKNIEDESIRKKFLNHQTFLNLVKMEWHSIVGLTYYLRLFMYTIFLVFYSINIEIYSKSNASSSPLNMACKIICLIFLFIFWFIEMIQLIFYAIQKNVFGYILDFKNLAEFINLPLCIFSLFYDIYGSSIEVKSSFYTITILISYYIFIKRLDKISFMKIGAKINVIGKIIKKSIPITFLLLIVAIGFILSFRNRSTYYEMSGLGGDDLTQMSTFNTTFEFNLFQILQFGLGGIATSQMGIDMIQGSNLVNYIIYGCFIFIMPIMFFNILTAISLDAIGDMMENASDDIILNKINYFELKEFYNKHIMENKEDKKFRNWIGRIIFKINEIIYNVQKYIYEEVYLNVKEKFWYEYLKNKDNSKTQEKKDSTEENLNLAKSIEKNKESLITMIKSLNNKVEINDRGVKQELEDKLNKINDKIETLNINEKEIKQRPKELEDKKTIKDKESKSSNKEILKLKINEIETRLIEMDEKLNNKIDEKFEQIMKTLSKLNNKRDSSESHSKSSRNNLDIANSKSKESEEYDKSGKIKDKNDKNKESVGSNEPISKQNNEHKIPDYTDDNKKLHEKYHNTEAKVYTGPHK
jgi:hypothetical protein